MMKRTLIVSLLLLVVAGMVGIVAADGCECPAALPGGLEPAADLLAGQYIDVGDIYVWNGPDCLYVWYEVTEADWYLTETHLDVQCDWADIPQTEKKKNPIPGQFAYGEYFEITDYETSACYAIPIPDCDADGELCDEEPVIAAHAVVVHVSEDCMDVVSDTTTEWSGDDLSYLPTYATYVHPSWPSITDATWIWRTAQTDPADEYATVPDGGWYFKKEFDIPGFEVISGSIDSTADNSEALYVNGAFIYQDGPLSKDGPDAREWETIQASDITNDLVPGPNTFLFRALNFFNTGSYTSNPAGLIYSADICYRYIDQEETAWGDGTRFTEKGNWGMYSTYTVRCCPEVLPVNGGFEAPDVADNSWDIFESGTDGLGWTVEWAGTYPGAPETALLEIHDAVVVGIDANERDQYAELDTDWGVASGEPASVTIYQDVCTYPGAEYSLAFAWKARNSDSMMEVYWDGAQIDGTYSGTSVEWNEECETVYASGWETRLKFTETGTPDSLGMFLDDVRVELA